MRSTRRAECAACSGLSGGREVGVDIVLETTDYSLQATARNRSACFALAFAHYRARKMRYPSSSLWRRPESRRLRAWRAAFCLDPGLRRDDNVLKSRHVQSARVSR